MAAASPPPPDPSPPARRLTPEQGVLLWLDVMNACEQFLLAGLRRKIGPDGDLQAAYREWHVRQMEEHDRMIFHMMDELSRRTEPYAPDAVLVKAAARRASPARPSP